MLIIVQLLDDFYMKFGWAKCKKLAVNVKKKKIQYVISFRFINFTLLKNKRIDREDSETLNTLASENGMPPQFVLTRNEIIHGLRELHSQEMIQIVIDMLAWTRVSKSKVCSNNIGNTRTTSSQDMQTWFSVQLAFAKFLSKIKGIFWGTAVSMIPVLY